ATFTFSSCLKDDLVENQTYGMIDLNSKKIVGFNETTQSYALAYENEDRILEIPVRLSSENPAEEDITVTLSLENSAQLIEEFNAENEQEYEVFNPELYELQGAGLSITIPKGAREGYLKIKV